MGGFETAAAGGLSGGIAATGNYPGKARTLQELRQDLERLYALLPGRHRLALHMSYGDFGGRPVDRDAIQPEHFSSWLAWGQERGVPLDINSTYFSHPQASSGLTLASKARRSALSGWSTPGARGRWAPTWAAARARPASTTSGSRTD